MFGFKIINEKRFNQMMHDLESYSECVEKNVRLRKDISSLRESLNEKVLENNKYVEENNVLYDTVSELESRITDMNKRIAKAVSDKEKLKIFKRDVLEALGNINLGDFRISVTNKKCNECNQETTDCKKYTFGEHRFCVTRK